MAEAAETTGALAHLRVLDLTRLYPGAFCTLLLADLGAEVVKLEAPGFGDGMRSADLGDFPAAHLALNRGKRSVTLNLKHEQGRDVLRRLVRDADVVVESQRPGALDDMGIGYDELRAENPRLVWCSITGFGSTGPRAALPGHDMTYLGASGLLSQLAPGATPPLPDVVLSVPMGALTAVVGILAAVARREHTGEGGRVDAAITEAATWAISDQVVRAAHAPHQSWGAFAARNVYRCADGRWVTVTATEPRSWAALCAALEVPDLVDHVMTVDEDAAITRLAEVFARRPAADWVRAPGLAGGVGPVHEPADLLDDDQVQARRGVVPLDGDGPAMVANPVRLDGADGRDASHARTPAPDLGQHTDEVLAAAGYSNDDIAALRDAGAI